MTAIIAAHFAHVEHMHEATAQLRAQGFSRDEYATYFLNPPGQHGLYHLGGDADSDEGTKKAGKNATAGAVAGGAAGAIVGTLGGPMGMLAGAGAGAYLGALAGALRAADAPEPAKATTEAPAEPPGGPMVAVNVDKPGAEAAAVAILGRCHARQIDRANGEWQEGDWLDFDPREPIQTLLRQGQGQTR